jgi:hypothetical protein
MEYMLLYLNELVVLARGNFASTPRTKATLWRVLSEFKHFIPSSDILWPEVNSQKR